MAWQPPISSGSSLFNVASRPRVAQDTRAPTSPRPIVIVRDTLGRIRGSIRQKPSHRPDTTDTGSCYPGQTFVYKTMAALVRGV